MFPFFRSKIIGVFQFLTLKTKQYVYAMIFSSTNLLLSLGTFFKLREFQMERERERDFHAGLSMVFQAYLNKKNHRDIFSHKKPRHGKSQRIPSNLKNHDKIGRVYAFLAQSLSINIFLLSTRSSTSAPGSQRTCSAPHSSYL